MVRVFLRRLVVVLSVLAFVSGMTIQAIPSAQAVGVSATKEGAPADPKCPRMAMEHHSDSTPGPLPCKGSMLDCVKQMGCIGSPNLPSRCDEVQTPASYTEVAYWSPTQALPGLSIEPDLFPPVAV
jgi:hypothetical protein